MKRRIIKFFVQNYNYPVDTANFIVAVSCHETKMWTSGLCKENRNLFGMKQPLGRKTTSVGDIDSEYASYLSFDDSLKDFLAYLRWFDYGKVYPGGLYDFVSVMYSNGYFEADFNEYYKGVSYCYQKLFSNG